MTIDHSDQAAIDDYADAVERELDRHADPRGLWPLVGLWILAGVLLTLAVRFDVGWLFIVGSAVIAVWCAGYLRRGGRSGWGGY
jgi:hypothetical protein